MEMETLLRFFSMSPFVHPKQYRNMDISRDMRSSIASAENPVRQEVRGGLWQSPITVGLGLIIGPSILAVYVYLIPLDTCCRRRRNRELTAKYSWQLQIHIELYGRAVPELH